MVVPEKNEVRRPDQSIKSESDLDAFLRNRKTVLSPGVTFSRFSISECPPFSHNPTCVSAGPVQRPGGRRLHLRQNGLVLASSATADKNSPTY